MVPWFERASPIQGSVAPKTMPKLGHCLCALLTAALLAPVLNAQLRDERSVKVAYVFNLTKYVEWPHAGDQLVVGFVGDGPMGEALEKMLAGRSSDSRPIRVVLSPEEIAQE